jgi:predicted nucleic acid-binding protein
VKEVVLDASAAVEIVIRTEAGEKLNRLVPSNTSWWVPNGLFDAEVNSVLRRLNLAGVFADDHIDSTWRRLSALRCRRVSVNALADRAWAWRRSNSGHLVRSTLLGSTRVQMPTRLSGVRHLTGADAQATSKNRRSASRITSLVEE